MSLRKCEISLRKAAAEIEAMELANKKAKFILEKEINILQILNKL